MTLRDIAKQVGVSKTVVSAVLNKKDNQKIFVSEEKKKKILELSKKLGFFPRKSARELITGRTNTIGVIAQLLTPYFSSLVEQLQKASFSKGYDIILYLTEGIPEKEEQFLETMADGRVDAVIITGFTEGSEVRYKKFSMPPYNLKILNMTQPIDGLVSVHFDEVKAGRIAAEYLIKTGCKKLCIVGGDLNFGRCQGFIKRANELGFKVETIVEKPFSGYYDDGLKFAKKILRMKNLPDGIFAFNDLVGSALISEFVENGIKIPEEISVISCDNTDVCLYTNPLMTSIDTRLRQRAKIAIDTLLKILENKKIEKSVILIEPELVLRKTTKHFRG
ncbi:MAG: LacI family transcriptional regulator [Candidatus Omnitrophica bacterium]|nr:LacI family transcriptional regulator [Candidatus Omnitrophota bacterium]